jgi:hypothetical protein
VARCSPDRCAAAGHRIFRRSRSNYCACAPVGILPSTASYVLREGREAANAARLWREQMDECLNEELGEAMLRLHVTLAANAVPDLVCQMRAAGQAPKLFIYRREDANVRTGAIVMDFDHVNERAAISLVDWLKCIAGVHSVDFEWRSSRQRERLA